MELAKQTMQRTEHETKIMEKNDRAAINIFSEVRFDFKRCCVVPAM